VLGGGVWTLRVWRRARTPGATQVVGLRVTGAGRPAITLFRCPASNGRGVWSVTTGAFRRPLWSRAGRACESILCATRM